MGVQGQDYRVFHNYGPKVMTYCYKIYVSCIGENVAKINTIDMLHHIETRMEGLTQVLTNYRPVFLSRDLSGPITGQYSGHVISIDQTLQELESLNQNKVEVARVTCEVERRQREKEVRNTGSFIIMNPKIMHLLLQNSRVLATDQAYGQIIGNGHFFKLSF